MAASAATTPPSGDGWIAKTPTPKQAQTFEWPTRGNAHEHGLLPQSGGGWITKTPTPQQTPAFEWTPRDKAHDHPPLPPSRRSARKLLRVIKKGKTTRTAADDDEGDDEDGGGAGDGGEDAAGTAAGSGGMLKWLDTHARPDVYKMDHTEYIAYMRSLYAAGPYRPGVAWCKACGALEVDGSCDICQGCASSEIQQRAKTLGAISLGAPVAQVRDSLVEVSVVEVDGRQVLDPRRRFSWDGALPLRRGDGRGRGWWGRSCGTGRGEGSWVWEGGCS